MIDQYSVISMIWREDDHDDDSWSQDWKDCWGRAAASSKRLQQLESVTTRPDYTPSNAMPGLRTKNQNYRLSTKPKTRPIQKLKGPPKVILGGIGPFSGCFQVENLRWGVKTLLVLSPPHMINQWKICIGYSIGRPKVVVLSPQSFKKSVILKGKKSLHGESHYIKMQRNQSETKDSSMSPSRGSIMRRCLTQ